MKLIVAIGVLVLTSAAFSHRAIGEEQQPPGQSPPQEGTPAASGTTPAVTTLTPMVVTATRTERSVEDLPVSATVIPREEIERAPVFAVDDLLRNIPSLNLPLTSSVTNHPTANFMSIRGIGGPSVLVLLDGVPINDPFFGFIQWNKVPLDAIERIEVVRGGSSSLFGTFALGGVVNIITRPPVGDAVQAKASYGSDNTSSSNLSASKQLTEALTASFNLNYFNTDGFIPAITSQRGAIDTEANSESLNLQLQTNYHPSPDFRWFTRGNVFLNDGNFGTRVERYARYIYDFATGFDRALGTWGSLTGNAFYAYQFFRTDNADLTDPSSRDAQYLSNIHKTPSEDTGGSLQWSRPFPAVHTLVTLGSDFRHIQGRDKADILDPAGLLLFKETGSGQQWAGGTFGQVSVFPLTNLEVLGSLRLDYFGNYDGKHKISTEGTTHFQDRTYVEPDPRLSVRYQLAEPLALRGSLYRAFRAATLDELYRPYSSQGFALVNNPQTKPEILFGGEIGAEVTYGGLHGQLNFFQNDIDRFIGTVPISFSPVFTLQVTNVGATRSRGVELMTEYQLSSAWSLSASYTYTDATITDNPTDPTLNGKRQPGVSKNAVSFGIEYRAPWGLSAVLRGRYFSKQYTDAANTLALDANTVCDLYLAYRLTTNSEVFFLAQNLFDEEYLASSFGNQRGAPLQVLGGVRVAIF